MKLIVHMGLHKTASTYFQHALNDNHAALAKAGVFYAPQAGIPPIIRLPGGFCQAIRIP